MAAAQIQRGRLFSTPDLLYGHLRDFRDEPDAATLQAGSPCIVASRTLVATGRRIPLLVSAIFLSATPTVGDRGMNVGGIPFGRSPNGFWVVGGLIAVVFALVAFVLFRFRFFKLYYRLLDLCCSRSAKEVTS